MFNHKAWKNQSKNKEMLEFWRHLQQKLISWTVKKMEWDADELER